jgi:NADH-quinone oxidoreductase subunit H
MNSTLHSLLWLVVQGIMVLAFIAISAMFLIWLERKVSARIQNRMGPMMTGPHGAFQSIADTIKLLLKENIMPSGADTMVWWLAPFFVTVPPVVAFLCMPFGEKWIVNDLNIGILFICSITSICVLGVFMAGWGSNNKYSLLGGMRSAAQIISYEVPLLLSVLVVIMEAGTMSMQGIVHAQEQYWFWMKPNLFVAFLVYLISATAEVNRVPFDIPEAESELVAGYHTEYSGMKFAMFFVAEYTNLFIISAAAATLFLGGWLGPIHSSPAWFLIKSYAVITFLMWIRWTLPRLRMDQMMSFAWKILTPIAIVNVLVTGFLLVTKG